MPTKARDARIHALYTFRNDMSNDFIHQSINGSMTSQSFGGDVLLVKPPIVSNFLSEMGHFNRPASSYPLLQPEVLGLRLPFGTPPGAWP